MQIKYFTGTILVDKESVDRAKTAKLKGAIADCAVGLSCNKESRYSKRSRYEYD
jgi:hypothetical protein